MRNKRLLATSLTTFLFFTGCNSEKVGSRAEVVSDEYYYSQYYLNKNEQNRDYSIERNISSIATNNFTKYMFDGTGVKVGISDSIFDLEHEDLQSLKILDTYFHVSEDAPKECSTYHGTSVLGLLGAERNNEIGIFGLIPNAEFFLVSVCNRGRIRNEFARTFDLMVDTGVQVINSSTTMFDNRREEERKIIGEALARGRDGKGTLLIKSAGNDSQELDDSEEFPNSANLMIRVGALGIDGNIAEFSNYGKGVDIYATGTRIATLDKTGALGYMSERLYNGNYVAMNGTSFSTPIVTGAVAMALEIRDDLTAKELKELLLASADDIGVKKLNIDRFLSMVLRYQIN